MLVSVMLVSVMLVSAQPSKCHVTALIRVCRQDSEPKQLEDLLVQTILEAEEALLEATHAPPCEEPLLEDPS